MKLYAKVNSHYEIEIDDASLGTAVCEDEHETKYNNESTAIFLSCGIVIPIFLILLLVMMVWNSHAKITAAMNKEQNHANLAAFALTGLVFSTFTVVLDIWALVVVVQESHEFNQHTNFTSLTFVIITTVFDAAIVLAAYITLIYLRCLVCCRKEHKPTLTLWVVASTCIAPLFCLTSHSGYIIMACMSDPRYPGPVTYIYIISFFYYFIIFRQLYNLWSKFKPVSCPELHLLHYCCVQLRYCYKKLGKNYSKINNEEQQQRTVFNHSVFFIEIWLSVLLVGAEVFVLDSFVTLPVTLAAPTDVYFAQLAVVIITALFAYNFIYTEDRHTQFMKAFVETFIYRNKCLSIDNLPNAEKAGKVLGGLAFAITRQYTEGKSKQLLEAFAANYNATDPDLHVANNAEAVGKLFGKLAFRIKHTDGLMEAFVINFKETNPEALRLDEQIKLEDAKTAGRMLGGLAFTIMDKCTENEPKQLVKAFVENFNNPNLHPDEPNHAQAATMVLGGLAFKIMQEHRPNDINPGDESMKLKKVFIDTFKDLHLTSLNNAKAAGNVLGRLAFKIMKQKSMSSVNCDNVIGQ